MCILLNFLFVFAKLMRLEIGQKIKALRLASELTQSELAARARLTKGFISQVERDQTSISLDSLLDILDALGITITEFFGDISQASRVFSPKDRINVGGKHIRKFEILIPGSTNNLMDPIMISLDPGESLPEEGPHSGEEFGYILSGILTLTVGKKTHKVQPRHCFYFEADQPHQFTNRGKTKTNFLWVTSPPQM
jgi:transcriptional regulator with XRE-family HTH domain